MQSIQAKNIDEYIEHFPTEVQEMMKQLRGIIKKAAPNAEETISYGIPCFRSEGRHLIYFAGYQHHVGIYPVPTNNAELEKEYGNFKTSGKGTLQLPLSEPVPEGLITKIVKFRLDENARKALEKRPKSNAKANSKRNSGPTS
jgi:uncharacterized protein YdhG (YjbR/CyaY superfamily)